MQAGHNNFIQKREYVPINLLSITGKLYASHLSDKFETWIEHAEDQAGFREGISILGQNATLDR